MKEVTGLSCQARLGLSPRSTSWRTWPPPFPEPRRTPRGPDGVILYLFHMYVLHMLPETTNMFWLAIQVTVWKRAGARQIQGLKNPLLWVESSNHSCSLCQAASHPCCQLSHPRLCCIGRRQGQWHNKKTKNTKPNACPFPHRDPSELHYSLNPGIYVVVH